MDEMTQIKVLHNVRTKHPFFKHKRAIMNDQNLEDAIYNLVFLSLYNLDKISKIE